MTAERPSGRSLPPTPTGELDDLVRLARRFGQDPEFSRAGGGNASVKVDGVLYIKPSGVALAVLTPEALVPLDMAAAAVGAGCRGGRCRRVRFGPGDARCADRPAGGGRRATSVGRSCCSTRCCPSGSCCIRTPSP